MYKNIAEIKTVNKAAGYHWFDRSTMRFFKSKIESGVYGGRFFVTSEQPPYGPRTFTIHEALPNGDIKTVSDFLPFSTLDEARKNARKMAHEKCKNEV